MQAPDAALNTVMFIAQNAPVDPFETQLEHWFGALAAIALVMTWLWLWLKIRARVRRAEDELPEQK